MTEYLATLTQIQSLIDDGMTAGEVQKLFPELDFSGTLEQIAAIQQFLKDRDTLLPGLAEMFGASLPEEILKITTDLDMTGAQARWNEFAANPGAITTDAVVQSYSEAADAGKPQPTVEAIVAKYVEQQGSADKAALTPDGLIAYVNQHQEPTGGVSVKGLTPENVTAMVSAYKELNGKADISALKPDEITAYIQKYLEEEGVDTTGLKPENITVFVLAYEEMTGGALTTALTPEGITAMVGKYLEAEGVNIAALKPDQVEAIVNSYAGISPHCAPHSRHM